MLEAEWKRQVVLYEFDMNAEYVYANPAVHADAGKTAVVRGPLVYCLEEIDNGTNLSAFSADTDVPLKEIYDKELFGGTVVLFGKGSRVCESAGTPLYQTKKPEKTETELKFVPYYSWGNTTAGEMTVWLNYE